MITTITAIGGLVGLVFSVFFLAQQTRAVAQQTKISNALAAAAALNQTTSNLREVYLLFISRPELRQYFHSYKPCPRGRQGQRVITIAGILANVLEDGLIINPLIPGAESSEDWVAYCRYMLAHSPTLSNVVRRAPNWWPKLYRLLLAEGRRSTAGLDD